MKCAIALKRAGNPTCNTQCASCKIWYGNGDAMDPIKEALEKKPATEHNPKEDVKEHATDKFTEEKVEREIPDPDEPEQETIRETEVVREQESIVTELEPGQNTTDGNFNPDK